MKILPAVCNFFNAALAALGLLTSGPASTGEVRSARFLEVDRNSNGFIEGQEAERYPMVQELFETLDIDNSGHLDPVEFKSFVPLARQRMNTFGKE